MQCGKGKGWKSKLMMLCCVLPLLIIIALPLFGVRNAYLSWLAVLACPLAMGYMMITHKDKECH